MPSTPVIAILDVGKTNKKIFLFDETYHAVWEKTAVLPETIDEDGDPCEDLDQLNSWIRESITEMHAFADLEIQAINYSAYGASLVHVGQNDEPVTPLYNYLKPYPEKLRKQFYDQYGGDHVFSMLTASPILGSLNSGMQLYRIKEEKPGLFAKIKYSLHLPQYLSWLFTGKFYADITSIGCHTNLWDFSRNYYHEWVLREDIIDKLPPIHSSGMIFPVKPPASVQPLSNMLNGRPSGIGLHDSSAAMIPYLENFTEPFILISTGTWCISMNPFDTAALTANELQNDCLCYLSFKGSPVKASRLFAGYEHERQVARLAEYFQKSKVHFQTVSYNPAIVSALRKGNDSLLSEPSDTLFAHSVFERRDLSDYLSFEEAYHRLMMDIIEQQRVSTGLICADNVKRIFVDGGFGGNPVYMHLLAGAFPSVAVFAAIIGQAAAVGTAMAIHDHWNRHAFPSDIIGLKHYGHMVEDF